MGLLELGAKFIPLAKHSKKPLEKYKDKTFDNQELLKKAKKHEINLGMLMQPYFVVIDIDTADGHGTDGRENFKNWCANNNLSLNELLSTTLIQQSPTGSIHLFYMQPDGEPILQKINFLGGVDIKGSKNNFAVVAPTVVPNKETGELEAYKFINPHQDPIKMPEKLAEAIRKEMKTQQKREDKQIKAGEVTDSGLRYNSKYTSYPVLDVFYTIEHGFGSRGTRNDNVFKFGQAMRKITPYETATKYAIEANKNSKEPYPENELLATLKSAYEYQAKVDTFEESGVMWVKLAKKPSDQFEYAVLKEKFDEENSKLVADYNQEDLYLCGEEDRNISIVASRLDVEKQTVYNYMPKDGDNNE